MPFISETQMSRVQQTVAAANNKLAVAKARAQAKAGEIKDGLEIVGAATLMGYARGMMEKGIAGQEGRPFTIPGTQIDIELLTGMGLVAAGMSDMLGPYDDDALMLGYGCLAHYMGQVARGYGKTSEFSMVAGPQLIGMGADPLGVSGGPLDAILAGTI